jgi:hypothetical protein
VLPGCRRRRHQPCPPAALLPPVQVPGHGASAPGGGRRQQRLLHGACCGRPAHGAAVAVRPARICAGPRVPLPRCAWLRPSGREGSTTVPQCAHREGTNCDQLGAERTIRALVQSTAILNTRSLLGERPRPPARVLHAVAAARVPSAA